MSKRNGMLSSFLTLAIAALSFAGVSASAAGQTVVSFRGAKWREAHFKDAATAKRHYDTLRQLGCEAKQNAHDGHHDVTFRASIWRSIQLKSDSEVHQWAHWLEGNGFETVIIQPPKSGHLEVVQYRLPSWKSGHRDSSSQAESLADTLRMLGCEVKKGAHGGHFDVTYRSPKWRSIGLENHEAAHNWEKWLQASGFETSHDHHTAQTTGTNRRR